MFTASKPRSIRRPSVIGRSRRAHAAALVAVAAVALSSAVSGCTLLDSSTVVVKVGYQSKTINTINAGTLMRDRGEFENALREVGERTGLKYRVVWQDFSSGAPLTAAMIATHVDIGSMGDYPLLANGSKTAKYADAATELIAVTGYNLRGSLNQVVVPNDSSATTLGDLRGKNVSTSLGSAGDGMLSSALSRAGVAAGELAIANQDPAIGAAAIQGGQVDALAQFVPWPQLVVFRGQGRLLYDGGDNNTPTFHGVVARKQFTSAHPEVTAAFLRAMQATTRYIITEPLQAAQRIGALTGIEPEVAYLYNGPNGLVSFDPTLKTQFLGALDTAKEFLVRRGSVTAGFEIADFRNDSYLRTLLGAEYDATAAEVTNPSKLTGFDELCQLPVADAATASEVWFTAQPGTTVAATPSCLLRRIAPTAERVRAGYVPDTITATKLFADKASWVIDPAAPATARYLPFATAAAAANYVAEHPGTRSVTYAAALTQSLPTS
ncbi:ABC transporter substrate-binding protein [Nocardia caishijiensis]|uniref:NitT/TauT family transport system substrate-binding protein n=1 Tax=Nocardia caishijiensis TaxID=184756 RepID=A0ABQ6YHF4_9NOCA|nr:ABC transporter substrate-binding protein [Nocardia caishijiensis]KAF0845227.1 NitT/TauT family transport system substrate-binding protein [Nocardia caishijiensis]